MIYERARPHKLIEDNPGKGTTAGEISGCSESGTVGRVTAEVPYRQA